MTEKNNAEPIRKVYYWKRGDGAWGVSIVHTTRYSEMASAPSEAAARAIAKKMGYEAVKERG